MATRFTAKDLDASIKVINDDAKAAGRQTFLKALARNGYLGLDEYELRADGSSRCIRNLECGTPRECLATAKEWLYN